MIMKFKGEGITNDVELEVSIIKSMIPLKEKMKCMRSARSRSLSAMCHYHHLNKWTTKKKSQINKAKNNNKALVPIIFSSAIPYDELVSPWLENLEHPNWK